METVNDLVNAMIDLGYEVEVSQDIQRQISTLRVTRDGQHVSVGICDEDLSDMRNPSGLLEYWHSRVLKELGYEDNAEPTLIDELAKLQAWDS